MDEFRELIKLEPTEAKTKSKLERATKFEPTKVAWLEKTRESVLGRSNCLSETARARWSGRNGRWRPLGIAKSLEVTGRLSRASRIWYEEPCEKAERERCA